MKVLVVGSGGREHAIVWKIKKDNPEVQVFCAPGNGGIGELAEPVPIKAVEVEKLRDFAVDHQIDMTVVGTEEALAVGITDLFTSAGLKIFGPCAKAAKLESSKRYAKDFMSRYDIPTAPYRSFDRADEALAYAARQKYPLVIKADGLAAGKGVVICDDFSQTEEAIHRLMNNEGLVIEEYMTGPEVSVLAFCDGESIVPMCAAQDHKRVFDGGVGPNTGGMGAISPVSVYTALIEKQCAESIFLPTLKGLQSEGVRYVGVLYFGLMLTADGPKVVEYNCRFGDPEAQVVLTRLKSNLLWIIDSCVSNTGKLGKLDIEWDREACASVVAASGGYPDKYETGYEIKGLCETAACGVKVFHAGTIKKDGAFYTYGGRVLNVTAKADSVKEAAAKAYKELEHIHFTDIHYRKDIGS